MVPRCQQIASKIDSKIDQKNDHLWDRLKIDFWAIWGPNLGGPGRSVGGPSGDFLGSWSSLGAKMSPRAPQDPPRPLQEPSWDWFLTIWGSNLMVFIPNLNGTACISECSCWSMNQQLRVRRNARSDWIRRPIPLGSVHGVSEHPTSVAKNAKCQVLGQDMPATYMPAGCLPRLGDLPYPPSEPRIP